MRFIDPACLSICVGDQAVRGEDYDDDADCATDGGTPLEVLASVTVTANGGSGDLIVLWGPVVTTPIDYVPNPTKDPHFFIFHQVPMNSLVCTTNTGVTFSAPPGFSVSNVAANGQMTGTWEDRKLLWASMATMIISVINWEITPSSFLDIIPYPTLTWELISMEKGCRPGSVRPSQVSMHFSIHQTEQLPHRHSSEILATIWLLERRLTHVIHPLHKQF